MLKIIREVFPSADGKEAAGGFEFGFGGVINIAADRSVSGKRSVVPERSA